MIENITGNVLDYVGKNSIVCHQTNCRGVMGSGLAKQIRAKYQSVYLKYWSLCNMSKPTDLLGTVQIVETNDGIRIANCFGQDGYGRYKIYTSYEALESCFKYIKHYAEKSENNVNVIAFPYGIGCGLAGGDWNIVSAMIEKVFADWHGTVKIVRFN